MSVGKKVRLRRLLGPSGRMLAITMDHPITRGLLPGLEDIHGAMKKVVAGRPDAITLHKGIAHNVFAPYAGEAALILKLAEYPGMLTLAAQGLAPHDVAFYLRDLAATYHSYYDAERILVDDEPVRLARLALVAATAQVLRNGLAVLGVDAPQKM